MSEETPDTKAQRQRDLLVQTSRRAWKHATALAFVALCCGVLLGGLSAWFLGAVALAGLSTATALVFNFHAPGALVRLLAIGRTAARYGERLSGHKAALSDQVLRRSDLFSAMARAPEVRNAGWQMGDSARLSEYLDDVDDLDFAKLRVGLPTRTIGFGLIAGLGATLAVAPLAIAPIALLLAACAVSARSLAGTGASALQQMRQAGRQGTAALGAATASVVALRAENAWQTQRMQATDWLAREEHETLRLRRAQAGFDALAGLVGPVAGTSVIGAAWAAGSRGEALLVPVFVGFAWLAFSEAFQGASRIVVADLRRRLAETEIARWGTGNRETASTVEPQTVVALSHQDLQRRAPNGRTLGSTLTLDLRCGEPTVLVGESGSGKTSLLKQLAGWIGDDVFVGDSGIRLSATERQNHSMFCPHDAAVLSDTVRANLFAAHADDNLLWAALEAMEMDERIRSAGGLDSWITQETLSLGEAQRLNLARAFLSKKPVILLDEPTEHLDQAQADRIVGRLLGHLYDRIVVASSHRGLITESMKVLDLDRN